MYTASHGYREISRIVNFGLDNSCCKRSFRPNMESISSAKTVSPRGPVHCFTRRRTRPNRVNSSRREGKPGRNRWPMSTTRKFPPPATWCYSILQGWGNVSGNEWFVGGRLKKPTRPRWSQMQMFLRQSQEKRQKSVCVWVGHIRLHFCKWMLQCLDARICIGVSFKTWDIGARSTPFPLAMLDGFTRLQRYCVSGE